MIDLAKFVEDCCDVGPELWVRSIDLSEAFADWCGGNGVGVAAQVLTTLAIGKFHIRMFQLGFPSCRTRRVNGKQLRTIEGVTLKPEVLKRVIAWRFNRDHRTRFSRLGAEILED